MADVVKEIEITAALSADYQDAFKAASSIASSSAKELSQLTKRETELQKMLELSSKSAQAAADGNAKDAEKLTAEYDKLAQKLGLVDTTAEGVAAELKKVGDQKKEVSALNESAKKSAAFGKLAKDIQTYSKAAKSTKDPAIIKQLDLMKKKFKEMGGVIPSEKKLGFFAGVKKGLADLPGPIGKVASGFGGLSKASLVVGGFAAVGAAAVAATKKIWDLGVSVINTADSIAKTSKQLGINAEAYQEFAWAVGLGGASEQDLSSGLQQLNKQMEAAQNGNAKAAKAFKSLGISMDEVKSMNTEEMFVRISDALAGVEDSTSKAKTMSDLFGGSSAKLTEAIKGGSAALEEMRKEARESGYVLSNEDLARAEEASDNFSRAQMQLKGVMNTIGVEVMPTINEVLTEFVQLMRDNKDDIKKFAAVLADGFRIAGKVMIGVMKAVPVIIQVVQNAREFWIETFAEGFAAADRGISAVIDAFGTAKDFVVGVFDTVSSAATAAFGFVVEKVETVKTFLFDAFDAVKAWVLGLPETVAGVFTSIKDTIETWWGGLKDSASSWVRSIVDSLVNFIMEKVSWLADSLKSIPIVGSLLDGDSPMGAGGGGSVTINVNNSVDARGAAPGAGAEISRAVQASSGQSGQAVAAAMANYQSLSYAG